MGLCLLHGVPLRPRRGGWGLEPAAAPRQIRGTPAVVELARSESGANSVRVAPESASAARSVAWAGQLGARSSADSAAQAAAAPGTPPGAGPGQGGPQFRGLQMPSTWPASTIASSPAPSSPAVRVAPTSPAKGGDTGRELEGAHQRCGRRQRPALRAHAAQRRWRADRRHRTTRPNRVLQQRQLGGALRLGRFEKPRPPGRRHARCGRRQRGNETTRVRCRKPCGMR